MGQFMIFLKGYRRWRSSCVFACRAQGAEWGFDRDDRALQGRAQAVQDLQDCDDRGASTSAPKFNSSTCSPP